MSSITASSPVRSTPLAALAAARLRSVDEPGRVEADRPDADARPRPAHEVAVGVEQHLVGVDVGVVVRHLHRVRDRSRTGAARTSTRRSPAPANVWCTGGGWWMRPTIGSKSWMLSAHGYTQPSQPTTSNGWSRWTCRLYPARVCTSTATSDALDEQWLGSGPRRSRSENGAPSASWPVGVRYLRGDLRCGCGLRARAAATVSLAHHPAMGDAGRDDDVVAGADGEACRTRSRAPHHPTARRRARRRRRCGTAGSSSSR